MKSKIETTTPQQAEIDWGKVMLVRGHGGIIVLSNGTSNSEEFSGTVIRSEDHEIGYYSGKWIKSSFQPLPLPQTITFYE
jgi:hypothetical protein